MTQRKGGFDWIRSTYRVPAKRGMRVVFDGRPGRILSVDGPYLMLHLDSDPKNLRTRVHPTWRMEYLP
ncbi:hypothetical protein PBI_EISH_80 [Mycobacterium phage Eish]|uniref:Uncharacterized protein n=15 Tax=Gracegardnervirinae TaxID=2946632 RepID=G1DUS3_9CAUD|nr:gp81 [Mycobacterium phage Ramsey]YP_009013179.1 hypothetical protein CL78_gp084 [Mycobacterium phage Avani]YP_009013276.1 hypothetical protein CL94_gp074 [Mycobacterium phage SG4]YP_009194610.1 hypothetical protein QUICO_86 [Mycobacterium phage Quico]YP_009202356.1 hypothetical protein AVV73_gp076 [Mycobacterium phage CaptainTrips]YP_009206807.1 hypothetical protein FLORINDA_89 [Mycobacterium phage Florinda]YP_009608154.1 hypothetical protein FDI15_gp079 [Mycobacterium phage ShiLan]YP_009